MPDSQDYLKWTSLTATVNKIKGPARFLKDLLFGREETLQTDKVEIGTISSTRDIAPFVRSGSEAVLVGGLTRTIANVSTPNIRLKRSFKSADLLYGRRPGDVILVPGSGNQVRNSAARYIAEELMELENKIRNAEEYMASRMLQGSFAYSVAGQENITITVPRASAHNITLSAFWDGGSATPHQDIYTVKALHSADDEPAPTDMVLGSEATTTFLSLVEAGTVKLTNRDGTLTAGAATLVTQFQDSGAIYLGSISGLDIWGYPRTATLNGASVDMVRPKYAEFFNRNSTLSDRVTYYGAVEDTVLQGRRLQGRRFSKSWEIQDPSSIMYLEASRPLCWMRRPDSTTSMKVVSG